MTLYEDLKWRGLIQDISDDVLFDKEKIIEEFNLSDNLEPVCLMPLGYRREDYKGSPWHNVRKNLDEIVTYL